MDIINGGANIDQSGNIVHGHPQSHKYGDGGQNIRYFDHCLTESSNNLTNTKIL